MLFRSFRNRNWFICSHIFGKGLPDYSRLVLSPILATWVFPRVTLKPPSKVDAGAMTSVNHCITQKAFLLPLKTPSLQSQPSPSTEYLLQAASPSLSQSTPHSSLPLHFFFFPTKVQLVGMLLFLKYPNPKCLSFRYISLASALTLQTTAIQSGHPSIFFNSHLLSQSTLLLLLVSS